MQLSRNMKWKLLGMVVSIKHDMQLYLEFLLEAQQISIPLQLNACHNNRE